MGGPLNSEWFRKARRAFAWGTCARRRGVIFVTSPTALQDLISVCFIFPEFEWGLLGNSCAWMHRTVAIKVVSTDHLLTFAVDTAFSLRKTGFICGTFTRETNFGEVFSRLFYNNYLKLSIVRWVRIFNSIILRCGCIQTILCHLGNYIFIKINLRKAALKRFRRLQEVHRRFWVRNI